MAALTLAALASIPLVTGSASAASLNSTIGDVSVKTARATVKYRGKNALLVKSMRVHGVGVTQSRPKIRCDRGCVRLHGRKKKTSKLFRPTVRFSNVNWVMPRGSGITVKFFAKNRATHAGRFVRLVVAKTGRLKLRVVSEGCIGSQGKTVACPIATAPASGCQPPPVVNTASLAVFMGHNPVGEVEAAGAWGQTLQLRGWEFDPDVPDQVGALHVYVGGPAGSGAPGKAFSVDTARHDINDRYPGANANHGFLINWPNVPVGVQPVFVYGINAMEGNNLLLWSGNITFGSVANGSPTGGVDAAARAGCDTATVTGWTVDTSVPSVSNRVHIYIDSFPDAATHRVVDAVADRARSDVAAIFPGSGELHGFSATIDGLAPGKHVFNVYGIETVGGGGNAFIGSTEITLP